jgi:hypothetical protein
MSENAQTLLPIIGVGWLLIQAGVFLWQTFRKKPDVRKD